MLDNIRNKTQSFGVKLIFGIIILVFVFWGIGNVGGMSGGAVASVNGENITLQEYAKFLQRAVGVEKQKDPELLGNEAKVKELKQVVLDEVIFSKLRLQEAKRLGLIVTPHELRQYLESFPVFQNDQGKFDPELYKKILAANNFPLGEFEQEQSELLLETKLMGFIAQGAIVSEAEARQLYAFSLERRVAQYVLFDPAEYSEKATISDEAVSAYYEENKERFRTPVRGRVEYLLLTPDTLGAAYPVSDEEAEKFYQENIKRFERPATFQSRHIFLPCPPDGSSEPGAAELIAEAKATAQTIEEKLRDGADFGDLARAYSKDPDSAENGGMLGWLESGQTGFKEFDDAALALKPGEVSGAVRTAIGIHFIKLEGRNEAQTAPLVEVKNGIIAEIGREKADEDFGNVQKKAEDGLGLGTPLADIGKSLEVAAQESDLIAQEELERMLALHSDSRGIFVDALAQVAAEGKAYTIPVPLNVAPNGQVLVRIKEARASEIPPLAEVKRTILTVLEMQEGIRLAKAAADEALPAFIGKDVPEAFTDAVKESQPVARVFPAVEPLGPAQELVEGLFSSSGVWLPKVYDTAKGPVIARTLSVAEVSDDEWNQFKGIFMAQYRQKLEQEAMDAFLTGLLEHAKIEKRPEALDQVPVGRS